MPADHFSLVVPQAKLEDLVSFLTNSLGHLGFKEMMRPVPNVVELTLASVRVVSESIRPVRARSLWCISTSVA